jgi:hypothetical protein
VHVDWEHDGHEDDSKVDLEKLMFVAQINFIDCEVVTKRESTEDDCWDEDNVNQLVARELKKERTLGYNGISRMRSRIFGSLKPLDIN